jgi:RHS repeat-associated protein
MNSKKLSNYEFSNHLGNVLTVFSDVKIALDQNSDNQVDGFRVPIRNIADYSPFGVALDGRTIQGDFYRYGYQGSEKDDEAKGSGNSYTTYFRQLDPRVGRWFSIDPETSNIFKRSPYESMGSNPITFKDPNGDDKIKFDKNGEFVSGVKQSKIHNVLFGSKAVIIDDNGDVLQKFKFNDWRTGQVKNFEKTAENKPIFSGLDLDFQNKMDCIISEATENAPVGNIFNKTKRDWIKNSSSDQVNKGTSETPLDFMTSNADWGGNGYLSNNKVRIIGNKIYDDFDAGNFLWGGALQKIDISLAVSRLGAHLNAFMYGKKQFGGLSSDNPLPEGFSFKQITWGGDSRADQKAIRDGYKYAKKWLSNINCIKNEEPKD